jgi:hypothetical protein
MSSNQDNEPIGEIADNLQLSVLNAPGFRGHTDACQLQIRMQNKLRMWYLLWV